ncbi:MAG: GTP-binding protein [Candidatus Helarchaeota archaeon]|nr:GTP-binding protein [Candidatus Helarchaeota archaeon]
MAIVPFPSAKLKGLIRTFEIRDISRRGGVIDTTIAILFDEAHDSIFYKYMNNFEGIFEKTVCKIINLEESKADKEQIEVELKRFYNNVLVTLDELFDSEISGEPEEFPTVEDEEAEIKVNRFKIVVCGDPAVGKTSTVLRFTNKTFRRTYIMTLGVNVTEKIIRIKNTQIKFVIWDIAGQSKFQMMRRHFYEGADGQLLIFDLTRPKTFQNIKKWYEDIKLYMKEELHGFIIGNKSDLIDQRKLFKDEILILAKELNLEYIETSALTGKNVDEAFHKLGELLSNYLEEKKTRLLDEE